ncbi:hypothetical protein BSKO_00568 [Bryopsis sp. KO-2023]|nr:hypothetical protein BSKO_00568 [Bryopsis sp. KO-2023]
MQLSHTLHSGVVRPNRSRHSILRASSSNIVSAPDPVEKTPPAGVGVRDGNKAQTPIESSENNKRPAELATIFGSHSGEQVTLFDQIGNDGSGPRFSSPFVRDRTMVDPRSLPIMLYFPGLDGTGLGASREFPGLVDAFELNALVIPTEDRTDFAGIVDIIQEFIETDVRPRSNGRPVYLLGESFGGLLAVAVADRCKDIIDRVVLVNPATSFEQSIWPLLGPIVPQIPKEIFGIVPYAIAPLIGNPVQMLLHNLDFNSPPGEFAGQFIQGMMELYGSLDFLGEALSPEVIAWKLEIVQQGIDNTRSKIPKVQQRVLLVVGDGDWMLPSGDEAERLSGLLPRCSTKILRGRSHAVLQEDGVDIVKILKEEGFYVTERRLSCPPSALNNGKINNFGTAGPIELPTDIELDKGSGPYKFIRRMTSPVFFSTMDDGRIVQGLDGVPSSRPILFVGNHQTYAPDTGIFVEEFLRKRQILVRGLAHPAVTRPPSGDSGSDGPNNPSDIMKYLTTFGAVPVTGRNFHKLLSQNENVLLYPGGVREAFKNRGEKYQLFWPKQSEFVRMAAKFGATIIPLATVGAEDSLTILFDTKDQLSIPVLGDYIRERQSKIPKARAGASRRDEVEELFVQPVPAFGVPARFYFLMGQPIETSPSFYNDKEKCQKIYEEVKTEVEGGLSYLIENREADPYKDFVPRMLYEASSNGKQAPTFKP